MSELASHDLLLESEERLRLAFWAANIGFWTWDLQSYDVYLSPIWKSQLGYEDHELPNRFETWEGLLHPDDRKSSWTVINEAQKDPQRIFEMYFRLRHKDQSYRWILSRGRVYRDKSGKPVRIMGCHVDVTQQKEDERLLRESEVQLRMALDGGRMGMWIWDIQNNKTRWNRREYELLDLTYESGNYTSHDFFACLHPDDRDRIKEKIRQTIESCSFFNDEFRVITSDGRIRWLVGAGQTICDPISGVPIQMMGVNYDITPSKQALESLQEVSEFNKQIIISAQEGIIVLDRELRYRVWNPYMEKLTGISEQEVLGKKPLDVFPFLKKYGIDECFNRALAGEYVQGNDVHYESKHIKESKWSSGRYGPLHNAEGQVIGVIATIQEITERKLAEQKLFDNQQRLQMLLDQSPSILWTTDRHLVITSSSGSGLKVLGLKQNQLIGMTLNAYVQADNNDHPSVAAHLKALQGHSITYEQDFSGLNFHVHLEPLRNDQNEIIGCIGTALDITERKQQEQERQALELRIQQAQKLESLEVLAGGIAHDFNNLLTGMLGYASLALMELPAESPAANMIREIEKAAQRAAELSRQMLAYSGKGKFIIESIRLDQLVVEMAGLLKTIVSSKAQLHIVADPVTIEGDATQIRQVVMNLITNAADAIQGEGYIAIRTFVTRLTDEACRQAVFQNNLGEGEYACLEVQDNGTGMTPEILNKIFDPFFTTKFTGRGLGLASVLGIIRGHHGGINVESNPGQGTRFRLFFPLVRNQAAGPAVTPPSLE